MSTPVDSDVIMSRDLFITVRQWCVMAEMGVSQSEPVCDMPHDKTPLWQKPLLGITFYEKKLSTLKADQITSNNFFAWNSAKLFTKN